MAVIVLNGERIEVGCGETIFAAADRSTNQKRAIPSSCNRSGLCKECIVEITRGHDMLNPPTEHEAFLERLNNERERVFRLACQAAVTCADGEIQVESFKRRLKIAMTGRPTPDPLSPWLEATDGVVSCDGRKIADHIGEVYGLAIDVGTTTVVCQVVDLTTGRTVAQQAFENPQRYGGSDVVHRISYEAAYPGHLQHSIIFHTNEALRELNIDRQAIFAVTVAGNTTMRDLFFGIDVQSIGRQPFISLTQAEMQTGQRDSTALWATADQLGLDVHPEARVYGLPLISHHVGADMTAVLGTVPIDQHDRPFMIVDIGTNTEVVIGDGRRLMCASCPAGPAFEGGRLSCGMAASDGAITSLRRDDGQWRIEQIGRRRARGICGSGLVDVLAELRASGEMDALGRFRDHTTRIAVLAETGVYLTRADASELAQAKAANGAGQAILLRRMGLTAADIGTYYLAGAFANHIDLARARAIGLILPIPDERIVRLGNASIEGAKGALLSRTCRARIEDLARRIEHVELEREPDFFELYAEMTQIQPMACHPDLEL